MIGLSVPSNAQKIPTGLTDSKVKAILNPAGNSQYGCRNLFRRSGDKTPQPIVAFLCLSFSAAFGRVYSVMAGCLGSLRAGRFRFAIFLPHSTRRHAVGSIGGGYSTLETESPK
jgi:hypothetical protein